MSEDESNPYLPPAPAAETLDGEAPLKDPRLRGWLAMSAIALNCAVPFMVILMPPLWHKARVPEILMITSQIMAAVFFLTWLYRCAANALILGRCDAITGPGWAVGSFFVPFVNLIVPFQVVSEIAGNTFKHRGGSSLKGLVLVWWIAFLIQRFISNWSNTNFVVAIIWLALLIVAGAIICYLIVRISLVQAGFRWSDAPESERPRALAAVSGPRMLPNVKPAAPGPVLTKSPPTRPMPPPPPKPEEW